MIAFLIPYLLLPLGAAAMLLGKDRPWSAGGSFLACTAGPPLVAYVLFELAVRAPGPGPRGMVEVFMAMYVGGGAWLALTIAAYAYAIASKRGVEGGGPSSVVPLLRSEHDN